jgi:hypothetical protein
MFCISLLLPIFIPPLATMMMMGVNVLSQQQNNIDQWLGIA